MEAAEITAVADKLAELLARAGDSGAGAFNVLAAEYRLMCIGYCVAGVLLAVASLAAGARLFHYARSKRDDWYDDDATCVAVVSCIAAAGGVVGGVALTLVHIAGALAPRITLLQQLLH